MDLNRILNIKPYSLNKSDKNKILNYLFKKIYLHHYKECNSYKKMMDSINYKLEKKFNYESMPFLPVSLFKNLDLKSVSNDKIVKTMTSSGTTGQSLSKIFLDKNTSSNQTRVLVNIISSFIGNKRVPMIILDSESVLKNRNLFSARGAGILGFSIFASKKIFAFDDKMNLKLDLINDFINENKNSKILLFGFTYMIWQYFCNYIEDNKVKLNFNNSLLIHGGGWKKLINNSVSQKQFKFKLKKLCGIENVHDYYGMVEQTGSIYMECEEGYLHTSVFSDVIIRDSYDFSILSVGKPGIIQVLSVLPFSYPGHSLLTEDEGILMGEDDCKCGRLGKYFKVIGRIKNAEIRGCSDTYE